LIHPRRLGYLETVSKVLQVLQVVARVLLLALDLQLALGLATQSLLVLAIMVLEELEELSELSMEKDEREEPLRPLSPLYLRFPRNPR
jgi:hypothetical protein